MPELDPNPWHNAAIEVVYNFGRFSSTTDELNRAHALLELSNAVADLKTFLPGWDYETGTMPWERDDDDDD